jgi:hypothetical protein
MTMIGQELDPTVEVAHLRRLLDIQPGCLLRLGADGMLLAASDAALALLGVASGAPALGRDFATWIRPDQHERWREFVAGVVKGVPASIECDMTLASGVARPTLFHAVPLADHPDGVPSIAVTARVVAAQYQLEASVFELGEQLREQDAERLQSWTRLVEAEGARRRLAEKVDELEARLREHDAHSGEVANQLKAEAAARDGALAAADAARSAAEAKYAQAITDVRQLEATLEEFAGRHKRVAAERAAERERTAQALETAQAAAQHDLEQARDGHRRLVDQMAEMQKALEELEQREREVRSQRDEIRDRCDKLLRTCDERDKALRQLEASHAELTAAYEAATAEHERLVAALRTHAVQVSAMADRFPRVDGEEAAGVSSTIGIDLGAGQP